MPEVRRQYGERPATAKGCERNRRMLICSYHGRVRTVWRPCAGQAVCMHAASASPCAGLEVLAVHADAAHDDVVALRDLVNERGVEHFANGEAWALAARHGVRALAALMVSDSLVTHESISPEARQTGFVEMVTCALEAAIAE